jgi:hypothetical protein
MIPHHQLMSEVTSQPWVPHPSGVEGCAARMKHRLERPYGLGRAHRRNEAPSNISLDKNGRGEWI